MMGPCIFYDPNDTTDAQIGRSSTGRLVTSPQMQRVYDAIKAAVLICRQHSSDRTRLLRMRAHILLLRLAPSRLENLRTGAVLCLGPLPGSDTSPNDMLRDFTAGAGSISGRRGLSPGRHSSWSSTHR
jgi:hypothetical protein